MWKIENFITNVEEIYKVTEFWDKRTNEAIIPSISDMVKAKSDHRNRPSSFTIQLAFMSFLAFDKECFGAKTERKNCAFLNKMHIFG